MSKRPANEQATKDNPGGGDDDGSWGATSGPPKATAAQLANRRIAQPRGGRRPAATGGRRPAPSSPALNTQQEPLTFGQTNGAQQQSGGGFNFGQSQQPSASASFPPFPIYNYSGNSSSFNPPSSSFSFGSQLASNPFAPSATFGGNGNNKSDQSTAKVQYSPSNNLFLQSSEVIQADAASAGLSPSVAAPHLGGFTFTKSSSLTEPGSVGPTNPPKKPILHINPPKDPMARKRPAVDELDNEGYPVKPAGPGKPTASRLADSIAMPPPLVPVKGQAMVFHNSAPPSKPGTFGSAGRTRTQSPSPGPGQSQPFVFNNTAPPSKPRTFGSAGRTIPSPATRAPLLIPEDPNADEMDTEATSAAQISPAPAPQNIFGGFGSAPVSTPNVFGNSDMSQVPQGLNPDFLVPVTQGSVPSHDMDEMNLDITEPSWPMDDGQAWDTAFLDSAFFDIDIDPEWQNADEMDTEDTAVPDSARNPFQAQQPPQDTPNMFGNNGKPPTSSFSFGQQNPSTGTQQASLPTFNWGQQTTSAATQPQQSSTPTFNWGQQSTPAASQTQPSSTPVFNWGQQAASASTQPQQSSTPAFNWGQQSTPASSTPQQSSAPVFNWGRQATSTSTQSEPSSIPAFSFAQPNTGTQEQGPSDSDAMVVSPEKKALGRSLFDRIEPPPASDPASFGQNAESGVSQQVNVGRASSPTKDGRQIAGPKKHVEDKPFQANPFSGLFVPKKQSSTTNSSPFGLQPQGDAPPASSEPSSGGLFGSLTNKNGKDAANLFKSLDHENNSTSNLFKFSNASQATSDQVGSNIFGAQAQAANTGGTLDLFKPSNNETTSQDVRAPSQPLNNAQNNGGRSASVADKPTNVKEQPQVAGRKTGQPPEPPQDWSIEEKKQYHIAYRLKQLDVGAEAKKQALIAAGHLHKVKLLEEFYRKTKNNIMAAGSGPVRPAGPSQASHPKETQPESVRPPTSRGFNARANGNERSEAGTNENRAHDQRQNHINDSGAPNASAKRKADDQAGRQQGQGPNESDKRARFADGSQISYPSLNTAEPSSNTSSMFKHILDKPAAMTNGESATGSFLSSFKPSESGPSALSQSSNNAQLAPNIFAASATKFQANTAKVSNGVITQPQESPHNKAPTIEPAKPPPSPFVFKPVTTSNDTSNATNNAAVKPPIFGNSGGPTNFLAQFGQKSAADSKKEMEKRKAEDMDSDEDEADWERRDAEAQQKKKQKLEQEASKLTSKFVPGKGFVFETLGNNTDKPVAAGAAPEAPASILHGNELDRQHEEYSKQRAAAANFVNPFAKLAKQDSGNEGSKNGDADDEEERSEEENQAAKKPLGGSLFDRISAPSSKANDDTGHEYPLKASSQGINLFGHLSGAAASVPAFNATNQTGSPANRHSLDQGREE